MTTHSLLAEPETIEIASGKSPDAGLFRIPADRVRIGMFVAELDRPWTDTPFPGHGLLVEADEQLAALRAHCNEVVVDAGFSEVRVQDEFRAAAATLLPGSAPSVASFRPGWRRPASRTRADVRFTSGHLRRVRELAATCTPVLAESPPRDEETGIDRQRAAPSGFLERLKVRLGGSSSGSGDTGRPSRPARLGAPAGQIRWPDPIALADALPGARPAFAAAERHVFEAFDRVRQGHGLDLGAILGAADSLVSVVLECPDAARWLTAIHGQRSSLWVPAIADATLLAEFGRHLGMPRETLLELATVGLLADAGKTLLPRELLEHPGMLSPVEFALAKQHVSLGLDMIENAGSLPSPVMRGIAEHHERLDGSGYPGELGGRGIGLHGRMAAIVDTYAALTTSRAYANALAPENALAALLGWSGRLFCPGLVEHFVAMLGPYPVGSLVELERGEVAVVVDCNAGARLHPRVVVLTAPDKGPLRPVRGRRGDQSPDDIYRGLEVRIARGAPAGAYGLQVPDIPL